MERVLSSTQATISVTFDVDGTPTDPAPATATVTITRADGTAVVTDAATTRTGVGTFSYTLTAAQTASLDVLTAAWTSSFGTLTTTTEIVGGFLFSLFDARRVAPLNDATTYPADRLVSARTLAETALEDLCGVAFVPRYARESFNGPGMKSILLRPRPLSVLSGTTDTVALSSTDLAGLVLNPNGTLYNPNSWALGTGNITLSYTHGYATTPPRVSQACLTLAKNWLVKGPLDDRMTSLATDDGTFALLTPGLRGSHTGIPEVDAVINWYGMVQGIA